LPWQSEADCKDFLRAAVDTGREASIRCVSSKGAEVDFEDGGYTPLRSALETETHTSICATESSGERAARTIRIIDMLFEAGATLDFRYGLGDTVLHTAAAISSPVVVQHLLDLGSDAMLYDWEYLRGRPIDYARCEEVRKLLERAMR